MVLRLARSPLPLALLLLAALGVCVAAAQETQPPAPAAQLSATDSPNDRGHAIILSWTPSPDDDGSGLVSDYAIYRAKFVPGQGREDQDYRRVGSHSASKGRDGQLSFSDVGEAIENNHPYLYRLDTIGPGGSASTWLQEPAVARAQWFNRGRWNMLLAVLVLCSSIAWWIQKAQSSDIYLRPVAGLKAFDEAVGRATEMGQPVLFVPGIMDMDQIETLAGVNVLGYVANMTSRYETPLEVPVSRSLVMAHAREVVKESYLSAGRPDLYKDDMIHYLTDDQFAYAAAVDGIMLRQKPAACFYQGKFYAESLILAETGNSIGAIQIAGTASPAQLPFFITACDYTLIGEEFFAASAYLSKDRRLIGSIRGQDVGKLIFMVALLVGVILVSLQALGVDLPAALNIKALFEVSGG